MKHAPRLLILGLIGLMFASAPRPATAQGSTLIHVMQPGESLLDLQLFYGLSAQDLVAANAFEDTAVGTGLDVQVPVPFVIAEEAVEPVQAAPATYVVQRGDTLFRIATFFNVSMESLAALNELVSYDRILVGQTLTIPASDYVPPSLEERIADSIAPLPEGVAPQPSVLEGKQIVVVLSQQKTYAFENGVLLRHFVVSTGLPGTPTVTGEYAVYYKYTSQRMTGPGYDLPGVPWVMYFYRGYALHGTYWHNNFGNPMSHGCVNMRTPEAEWLYNWAPIGTPVRVIW